MNKVILMGRLTKDPEIRYTVGENPKAVARYSLAVVRRFKKEGEPSVDYIGCVAFGTSAEFAESKDAAAVNEGNGMKSSPSPKADGFINIPDSIEEDLPFK